MSHTRRAKRPQFYGSARGTVRDGARQHATASCEHHGGCPHCLSTRTHATERRKPALP